MSEIKQSDFATMLAQIYAHGGEPEYVLAKCPICGAPFEYAYGEIKQGHMASACPQAAP